MSIYAFILTRSLFICIALFEIAVTSSSLGFASIIDYCNSLPIISMDIFKSSCGNVKNIQDPNGHRKSGHSSGLVHSH